MKSIATGASSLATARVTGLAASCPDGVLVTATRLCPAASTAVTPAVTTAATWHGSHRKLREFSGGNLDGALQNTPVSFKFACGCGHDIIPSAWTILPTSRANEYAIASASAGTLLSASKDGTRVTLASGDDGSGRQRWVFRHVGTSLYTLRVAGGKADKSVYLGVSDDHDRLRLFASASKPTQRFEVVPLRAQEQSTEQLTEQPAEQPADKPEEQPAAQSQHVPPGAAASLAKLSGLTAQQIDVVMQLVSLPENSTPKWYTNYGYIEFLGDGRGFTTTIFGACSGTGDLAMVFEELAALEPTSDVARKLVGYLPKLRGKEGDDISGIEALKDLIPEAAGDESWRRAVWSVYVKLYWKFAADFAAKRGACSSRPGPVLASPAAKGFVLDTVINHGADMDSVQPIIDRMSAKRDSGDETAWMLDFAEARRRMLKSGYDNLDTSHTGDRATLWAELVRDNPDLRTPIDAYEGYWGSFTIRAE